MYEIFYKRIKKDFTICWYSEFLKLKNISNDCCLIIDEIHNLIWIDGFLYNWYYEIIEKLWNNWIVIFASATPIYDNIKE